MHSVDFLEPRKKKLFSERVTRKKRELFLPPVPFPVPLEYIEVEKKIPANFLAKFVDLNPIGATHKEFRSVLVQIPLQVFAAFVMAQGFTAPTIVTANRSRIHRLQFPRCQLFFESQQISCCAAQSEVSWG